jgi:hypothetical protein
MLIFCFAAPTLHHALSRSSHPTDLLAQFSHCCIFIYNSLIGCLSTAIYVHTLFLITIFFLITIIMEMPLFLLYWAYLHTNLTIINFPPLITIVSSYSSQIFHDTVSNFTLFLCSVFHLFFIPIF